MNVRQVVEEAVDLLATQAVEKGLELTYYIHHKTPPPPSWEMSPGCAKFWLIC
ncbi:MAG: hypothetical protein R3D55_05600 [Chloroflexota bacterium]